MTSTGLQLSTFPKGSLQRVVLGSSEICVYHLGDGVFATDNLCTNKRASLAQGEIIDGIIECPRHGCRFDIRTGEVRSLPAFRPLAAYPVEVQNDLIYVHLPNS